MNLNEHSGHKTFENLHRLQLANANMLGIGSAALTHLKNLNTTDIGDHRISFYFSHLKIFSEIFLSIFISTTFLSPSSPPPPTHIQVMR